MEKDLHTVSKVLGREGAPEACHPITHARHPEDTRSVPPVPVSAATRMERSSCVPG